MAEPAIPEQPINLDDVDWSQAVVCYTRTTEGLRERLIGVVTRWALTYPLAGWPWPGRTLAGDAAQHLDTIAREIAEAWGRDIADKVLVELLDATDPGDDPHRQMVEHLGRAWPDLAEDPVYLDQLAHEALSVRWEKSTQLAAENAQLRARAEHAEGQLSALRDHNTRWEAEHARAERLDAELADLQEQRAQLKIKLAKSEDARRTQDATIERARALRGRSSMGRVNDYVPVAKLRAALDGGE